MSEVLRHLAETGAIYQDAAGRWTSETTLEQVALPDSVREVIGARVGRLGKAAERVLSMAAVIGRDFDLDVLARATRTTEDELLDILEAASAVALVREPANASGQYTFAHALIQRTLAEDLGPNRRARAHRQVAEALEDLCGDRPGARVGELARHWLSATQPIDAAKAISYAHRAGDAALAALAPADALSYYVQALDLYPQAPDPDPVLALDLAIGLGTAQRQTGNAAFRETLLDAARLAADLDDVERLGAAALANHRGSSAHRVPSTLKRSRFWRSPSIGFPMTTAIGPSCSPRCVPNSRLGAPWSAGNPWRTRPSPLPSPRVMRRLWCVCSTTCANHSGCLPCTSSR